VTYGSVTFQVTRKSRLRPTRTLLPSSPTMTSEILTRIYNKHQRLPIIDNKGNRKMP